MHVVQQQNRFCQQSFNLSARYDKVIDHRHVQLASCWNIGNGNKEIHDMQHVTK